MKILVTGGLGYIGSHTAVALIEAGYEVVIVDNCSNASESVLVGITNITGKQPEFHKIDLRDKETVISFFKQHGDLGGIIHFAASKAVGESVENPLLYYENNINTLTYILQQLLGMEHKNFIFSSSCTVYGQADKLPITEDAPVKPAESPYGNTKQIGEEIIRDACNVNPDLKSISLRYFNPIGAHESAEIGELPLGEPQNLVPFITQTAIGVRKELSVFGNDYPTPDGTCIRDYIHVMDLATVHVIALERLMRNEQQSNYEMFNVGTGRGNSVLEVIQSFERVAGIPLKFRFAARRPGDVVSAYADTSKARSILGWEAQYSLDDAIRSAWKWEQETRKK